MAVGQFHINPKTGDIGRCTAKIACPYGELGEHFSSKEDALRANEQYLNTLRTKVKASKRGRSKESFGDAKNSFMRAALDRVLGTDGNLADAWRIAATKFYGCCYLCGERIYDKNGEQIPGSEIQADHIVPPKMGGTISAGNMAPAHRWCNDDKGDTPVEEYLTAKGRPDLLKLVHEFQQEVGYEPPPIEVVVQVQEELEALWSEMEGLTRNLRSKYQAMF